MKSRIILLLLFLTSVVGLSINDGSAAAGGGSANDLHRHIHQLHRARFDYRGHGQGQRQSG